MDFRRSTVSRWSSFQGFFFIFGAQNFPHRKTWAKTNQVLEIPVPKKRPKIIKGNGEATINTIVGGWTIPKICSSNWGNFLRQTKTNIWNHLVNHSHVTNPNSRNAIHIWIYIYISARSRITNQPAGSQAVERWNPEKLAGETKVLGETCWSDNSIDEIFFGKLQI